VTGLAQRSPVRKHIWFDPAEADQAPGDGGNGGSGKPAAEPAGDTSDDKTDDTSGDKAGQKHRRRSATKASGSR